MSIATQRTRRTLGFVLACALMLVSAPSLTGANAQADPPADPPAGPPAGIDAPPARALPGANGVVPPEIADRYLTTTPSLGTVTIARIGGESSGRRLLAATLQGIVNRTSARLYLVGMRPDAEDQYWIDHYLTEGLITVGSDGNLDAALDQFAGELAGYVVADEAEPWTINTATSVAAATGGVVITPELIPSLQGRGLTQIADHRHQWPDAATAYAAIAATYADDLAYPGLAIQEPGRSQPRDFFVQQGVMTVFTRPSQSDFDAVYDLLDPYPIDRPVYGYVSDTGAEEVQAVARLAQAGRFLVPTNTTDNLSFHVAVAADQPRAVLPDPAVGGIEPCTSDDVNVVLAVSDGDNIVIPEANYPTATRWNSPARGELALGWSMGPATAVLMPSVWDHYASTASSNDEIVGMMGLGYTYTTLMPNAADYFAQSFRLDRSLGVRTHWSLDAFLTQPDAVGWANVEAALAQGVGPEGILLNYQSFGGPDWFHEPGLTVLGSGQTAYEDGAPELVAQIQALVDLPAADRSPVNFFAVTTWNTDLVELDAAVAPLEDQGVRFLTPAQAVACLPDPPPPPTTSTTAGPTSTSTTTTVAVVATPRFTA